MFFSRIVSWLGIAFSFFNDLIRILIERLLEYSSATILLLMPIIHKLFRGLANLAISRFAKINPPDGAGLTGAIAGYLKSAFANAVGADTSGVARYIFDCLNIEAFIIACSLVLSAIGAVMVFRGVMMGVNIARGSGA